MSPPPSPSLFAKHLFYPDEYPFPSPMPSPRVLAPQLVLDTICQQQSSSDDSDAGGLCTPPEPASLASTISLSRRNTLIGYANGGGSPSIEAPGHPPIPGLGSPTSSRGMADSMFAVANALNGHDIGGGVGYSTEGFGWPTSGKRSKLSNEATKSPKKVKSKKQAKFAEDDYSVNNGEATTPTKPKRTCLFETSWTNDAGCLGGF